MGREREVVASGGGCEPDGWGPPSRSSELRPTCPPPKPSTPFPVALKLRSKNPSSFSLPFPLLPSPPRRLVFRCAPETPRDFRSSFSEAWWSGGACWTHDDWRRWIRREAGEGVRERCRRRRARRQPEQAREPRVDICEEKSAIGREATSRWGACLELRLSVSRSSA